MRRFGFWAWTVVALWGLGFVYLLARRDSVHPDVLALYGELPFIVLVLLIGAAVLVERLTKPRR